MLSPLLQTVCVDVVNQLYSLKLNEGELQVQKTLKNFEGDMTLVTFPLVKKLRKSPEIIGNEIGDYILENDKRFSGYQVVKGFLNLSFSDDFWIDFLNKNCCLERFSLKDPDPSEKPIVIEFSSPNTNKPMHLGHIRNNLLGWSIAEILKQSGRNVVKVNLVNDRGIHICKSMLAWQKWGNGETPETSGQKGDHLIGKYYVMFESALKEEVRDLVDKGSLEENARKNAPLMIEAQEMLRKWENADEETYDLWKILNGWVMEGFHQTYADLGINFDRFYFESDTYLVGKTMVAQGLEDGHLYNERDNSIWIDLEEKGLDKKLLLRADGTSVYMTQDLGNAKVRIADFNPSSLLYVVGNEQNYHFDVLKLVLKDIGYEWADIIEHISYGMVELPEGKMKSREGTVVDADDLLKEMMQTAEEKTKELGKIDELSDDEAENLFKNLALGALKFFILKVDPKKNMLFNPSESIDFNGNTGPFIQYSYARISSLLSKGEELGIKSTIKINSNYSLSSKEKEILRSQALFSEVLEEAALNHSPAIIANYIYELAKEFNQFYHDHTIFKAESEDVKALRLQISKFTGHIIRNGMHLLGISVPERM